MRKIKILLLAILFFGCARQSVDNNLRNIANSTNISISKPVDTLVGIIGCYYKLDSKYNEIDDTSVINNWLKQKLNTISESGISKNLFNHKSGGPNGVAWNSATDLYIFVVYNRVLTNEIVNVKFNKKEIYGLEIKRYIPSQTSKTIVYFKLKQELWEINLREVEDNDIKYLYGEGDVDSIQKENVAPLDIGEIIEISVDMLHYNTLLTSNTGYFHIAYGE